MIKVSDEKRKSIQAEQIRVQRDALLAECDWTMVADTPTDKSLWGNYRQELRDLTSQAGFPDKVQWPAVPA